MSRNKPQKKKWLIFCCYNLHKYLTKSHFLQIKKPLDWFSKSYENIILTGKFNPEIFDSHMESFCAIYHLKNLIKKLWLICIDKIWLICIYLILTNSPKQFQAAITLETDLSDFQKMAVAAFKSEFLHQKPNMISYWN